MIEFDDQINGPEDGPEEDTQDGQLENPLSNHGTSNERKRTLLQGGQILKVLNNFILNGCFKCKLLSRLSVYFLFCFVSSE